MAKKAQKKEVVKKKVAEKQTPKQVQDKPNQEQAEDKTTQEQVEDKTTQEQVGKKQTPPPSLKKSTKELVIDRVIDLDRQFGDGKLTQQNAESLLDELSLPDGIEADAMVQALDMAVDRDLSIAHVMVQLCKKEARYYRPRRERHYKSLASQGKLTPAELEGKIARILAGKLE